MNATEYLKTEADPDDVIAITTYVDWELHHLTNIMEAYHQRKMESLTESDLEKQLQAFLVWQVKEGMFTGRMPQLFTDIKQYLKTKEGYHQRKMESLTEIETLQIVLNWYTKDCSYILQDESGSDLEEILESYLH